MSSFSGNRFDVLLGDEDTDTDKLGNTKPVAPSDEPPRSKRDGARKLQTRVAVSPPSHRRGRDRGIEGSEKTPLADSHARGGGATGEGGLDDRPRRGRQYDRHSSTGIHDNEKKINQGWGRAEKAQEDAANDVLSPDDPAAEGGVGSGTVTPSGEANFKTLDEYLSSQAALNEQFRKLDVRPPNEGSDSSQWKDAVLLERDDEEDFYFSGKERDAKQKSKNKKEKVYLEIDHPPHRPSGRGGHDRRGAGRGPRRGRGGSRGQGRSEGNKNVNLSDDRVFPTLRA